MDSPRRILALVPEMMTGFRVEDAARKSGASVRVVNSPVEFAELLQPNAYDIVLVDLAMPGIDLRWLADAVRSTGVKAIAYGPHVDVALLRMAREAGLDQVLPRSRVMTDLIGIFRDFTAPARA